MKNKIMLGVVLGIILIAGFLFLGKKTVNNTPSGEAPIQRTQGANEIAIRNFSFVPGSLIVPQGTTVTWTNQDSTTHKITSTTFNSEDLKQGDTFAFTFPDKGSYDYSCSIHPSMTGKIVVE